MSELFSRGEITTGNSFHIVARVKDGVTGSQLSSKVPGLSAWNSGTDTPGGTYFFLCQNQYRLGSNSQQRLYFSCDPEDFQKDYNHNSLNEGTVFVKSSPNLNYYTLEYSTSFDKNNNKVPPYFKTISKNLNQQSMVNISSYSLGIQFQNTNFNLSNSLFLSVPYNFNFISNQTLQLSNTINTNWVFRNVTSSNTGNINFYNTNLIDLSSKLNRGNVENISFSLSSSRYTIVGNTLTIHYSLLTIPDQNKIKRFSQNEGIIQITTTNEIIIYKTITILGNGDYEIFISKRGAAGTTETSISGSINIQTDIRNSDTNFTILNNVDLSSVFDFYLLPSTSIAYFYQGRNLKNMIPSLVRPDTVKVYSRETGVDGTLGSSRLFFNFFSYYLLNDLVTHWTRNGLTGFPNLATFQYHNSQKSTLFTWESGNDSSAGFMFDYCNQNQNCGSCFGVTKFNSALCYADGFTRDKILNDEPNPLAIENRSYSSSDQTTREGIQWGLLAFHIILLIFLIVVCIRSYPSAPK